MPVATVLVPTHDHAATLPHAVGSVQEQGVADLEIVIVGDGVGDDTRDAVADLARTDARVRFLDREKGERHGERHRHEALAGARGAIVCYAADDDLWLPWHVETLQGALADADLAHTLALGIDGDGAPTLSFFDAGHRGNRRYMERARVGFGLANGAHTLAAYRRLPHGWRPAPPDVHSDLHMWRQFLDAGCRVRGVARPTVVHFGSPFRKGWTAELRAPDAEVRVQRLALEAAGARYGADVALRFALGEVHDELRAVRRGRAWRVPRLLRTLRATLRLFRV